MKRCKSLGLMLAGISLVLFFENVAIADSGCQWKNRNTGALLDSGKGIGVGTARGYACVRTGDCSEGCVRSRHFFSFKIYCVCNIKDGCDSGSAEALAESTTYIEEGDDFEPIPTGAEKDESADLCPGGGPDDGSTKESQ